MSGPGLALGTVQFGLAYGVAGRGEAVPEPEVRTILERAVAAGIRVLDTAPVYGDIESRLARLADGLDLTVVSKIARVPEGSTAAAAVECVRRSAAASLERLGSRLTTLLFHHADDLLTPPGEALWRAAGEEAGPGVRLGVSCYSPASLAALGERFPIAVAQLPGNALDQRLTAGGIAARLERIDIHLRSVFLQGLLLMPLDAATRRVPAAAAALAAWGRWCAARGLRPITAALAVARALPAVRLCVVGVDRADQLDEVVQAWRGARPAAAPELASTDPDVIDPRCWSAVRS